MTNLILSGGSGTRLWPLSRNTLPKQFLPLFGGQTLFHKTVLRNREIADKLLVVTGLSHEPLVRRQLSELEIEDYGILTEPIGRNTAPAITLACLSLPRDELVLVTPSDHLIGREDEYRRAVKRAMELASDGGLVTFGIKPDYAETGYGYIECTGESVLSFREKPDEATAQQYIAAGRYLWNSGMVLFQVGAFLDEVERWAPEVLSACRAAGARPTVEAMRAVPAISVDYAVLEKSHVVKVVPCDPDWSDVGTLDALAERLNGVGAGGQFAGPEPLLVDAKNNAVVSATRKIVLIDVEDLVVVDTPDALLVMKRGSSQKVKTAVDVLKNTHSGLLD